MGQYVCMCERASVRDALSGHTTPSAVLQRARGGNTRCKSCSLLCLDDLHAPGLRSCRATAIEVISELRA